MKKILCLILALTFACCVFAGCGGDTQTTDSSTASADTEAQDLGLLTDGTLTIGMEIGYPPFEYYSEDGVTPVGYDIDLAYALGEKLGLEITFKDTAFDVIAAGLGVDYDIILSAYTITPEREATMLFSTPYIQNFQSVVAPKGADVTVAALTDLSGKTLAYQKGTTTDELITDYIETGSLSENTTTFANEKVTSCFTMLENGEVDLVVCDSTVAEGTVAKNPEKYEIIYTDTNEPEEFGIGITEGNEALQKALNDAIAELEAEGFFTTNQNTWFGN